MDAFLFVCTGNTCRSAMAEAMAAEYIRRRGLDALAFSRGLTVPFPSGASAGAAEAARRMFALDLSGHRARQLSEEDMERARVVLAMTRAHESAIVSAYPQYRGKVYLLGVYAGRGGVEIADPFGGGAEDFSECARLMESCIAAMSFTNENQGRDLYGA